MKADDIKVGHFYRFRGSNTILAMIFEWKADDAGLPRELEYFAIHHDQRIQSETRRKSAQQIADLCSCEVRPTWSDVEAPDAEPVRSKATAFIDGLLGR